MMRKIKLHISPINDLIKTENILFMRKYIEIFSNINSVTKNIPF